MDILELAIYGFLASLISYSCYSWVQLISRKKNQKKLREKYPKGFTYGEGNYYGDCSEISNLPPLEDCDVGLFESCDLSNIDIGTWIGGDGVDAGDFSGFDGDGSGGGGE